MEYLLMPLETTTKIIVCSHFFKVENASPRFIQLLLQFSYNYTVKGFVRDNSNSRSKPVFKVIKTFAIRNAIKREFRFHIGQLQPFLKFIKDNYILETFYELIYIDLYTPHYVNLKVNSKWVLKDYQEECRTFVLKEDIEDNRTRLVSLQTGAGKALSLSSPIKIPNGWSTMGDMQVGTEVIAKDGTITKVNGVYYQGLRDIYKVTFKDGRTTRCTLDHLWKVHFKLQPRKNKVLNTKQIMNLISTKSTLKNRLYIDLIDSEQNNNVNLPINPYVLGCLLGDGHLGKNRIDITTPDNFIVSKLTKKIHKNIKLVKRDRLSYGLVKINNKLKNNHYLQQFRKLNLTCKLANSKFIPNMFLNASTNQRLELLQGLMDTDGYIDKHSSCSYTTVSKQLAKDVQYLVRSLGGIASISTKIPFYSYLNERKTGQLAYNVNIRYKKPSELFTLPKKKNRANDNGQYCDNLKLRIESIEHVGQEECQCISIDHPDKLYVTDDFIVTHNTVTSLISASDLNTRIVIILLSGYMDKWVDDLLGIFPIDKKDIMYIKGSKSLKGLINLATDNKLQSNFIIISLDTIQNYFKTDEETFDITEEGYECRPEYFFPLLKAGVMIIDETHQHIHAVYKLMCYTHIPKIIALSATLISDDPSIKLMHTVMFPKEIRFDHIKLNKYIKVYAISYEIQKKNLFKVKTTEYGSNTYSHLAVEKSIIKHRELLNSYVDYVKNDKLIIFASSIAMCTEITNFLKKKLPKYDVRRYVEKDPYENVIDADIRVTTILSAGTALDIPNLRATIMTNSISSSVSNVQTLGRLRDLKTRDTKFYYLYSSSIKKHIQYHQEKMLLFRERVLSIKEFKTTKEI
jgi:superfamily II DNA or RNA helicase